MKGVKTLRLFYNGRCIRSMSECKTMKSKSKGLLIAKYKFNNTLYDNLPMFNDGFSYTYKDVVDGDVTTRTIYSDSLPSAFMFGYDQGATE